jgi:hypothetical protein
MTSGSGPGTIRKKIRLAPLDEETRRRVAYWVVLAAVALATFLALALAGRFL